METARTDILYLLVHLACDLRDLSYPVFAEFDRQSFGFQERCVLLDQRVLREGEDLHEIIFGEAAEFHTDREASLQLRNEVGGLGDVERAGGNKEDMVCLDHAIFGHDA